MQIRNNYQLEWEVVSRYGIPVDKGMGVFNGDMGRILEIREAGSELVVEFDEGRRVTYPFPCWRNWNFLTPSPSTSPRAANTLL